MADSGSAGDRGGGGGVAGDGAPLVDLMARKPPRPSLTLPPRSSLESLFHGGGGGGASEVSPGPLTLVSSFFAEDPESDRCSFTQLLVGEINSPAGGARGPPGAEGEQKDAVNSGSEDGGAEQGRVDGNCAGVSGLVRMGKNRPAGLEVSRPEAFMFPPGESPASLMISPGFFSSALGTFAVSHQEALAQVTAQASQSQFTMPSQAENSCVLVTTSLTQHPVQEIPTLKPKYNTLEPKEGSHSDHRPQPPSIVVDKPADDGYNWRKYGQKIVKGSEYPRSYYKCSHPNCPVKKKIEHSVDGQISEIIYKGQHNHQRPKSNKRSKEGSTFATSSNESTGNVDNPSKLESDFRGHHGNLMTSNGKSTDTKSEQLSDYGTSEQLSGTSDREEAPEMLTDEREDHDADAKRMKVVASSQASSTEPRIVVQTTSEVDLLDDGYRWRKYGQKVVKGNPNPRSYYKCTFHGCNVRKHIERAATDPKAVITTYEGKHNHDVPSSRNSHHNMMVASAASSIVQSHSQASLRTTGLRNNDQQSLAVLQLKKEHEIT